MKHTLILLMLFFIACNEPTKDTTDNTISVPVPEIKLSPLQTAVQAALIDINTTEIESTGNAVITIQIEGMEIMKISKKNYYLNEMTEQETNFKNYVQYISKLSKTKNPLIEHTNLKESQAKHDAVMSYLKTVIKTSSSKPEIYKVVYYLKADTKNARYDQVKTTYLDTANKKMVMDYGFLK